jgi:hypothetical protein
MMTQKSKSTKKSLLVAKEQEQYQSEQDYKRKNWNIGFTMTNKNEAPNKTEITLKGSVEIVSEFFFTAINSILYQRGTLANDFW